ncbi:hypothetical protein GCM10027034_13410 [Ramlibacter solisilvae]|uniref:Uncharacterized protein n=1 Tax=Ramlibacter tataouinensis TaxID=94132 RepID=A0A127JX02_9BURK|nr:hypothetical protein [Ramlibacter tataouinensis]AMO24403.1 hypothetical protein UC35_18120 [Ramlibacter tataouinensis]
MPEQLTKHPEVTLQVLRSAGAKCGEGAVQEILTQCPAEHFCKLPGGELCVYGLPEAARMTQFSAQDWQALSAPQPVPPPATFAIGGEALAMGGAGLILGMLLALIVSRRRARRR